MNLLLFFLACETTNTAEKTSQTNQKTSAPAQSSETTQPSEISVTALYEKTKSKDVIIIDVRTPQEYTQGHLPKAQNIPLQEFDKRMGELSAYKNKELFLVCASGGRSHTATQTLLKNGFTKAQNVLGGTRGWQAKGYPTDQ